MEVVREVLLYMNDVMGGILLAVSRRPGNPFSLSSIPPVENANKQKRPSPLRPVLHVAFPCVRNLSFNVLIY